MRRTGAVYIAVLMASLLVGSLTIAALHSAHYYARSINDESDYNRCQLSADAGLEWAVARINAETTWRAKHVNNVDIAAGVINGVSIRYRLIDNDGSLLDNPGDGCDLLLTASTARATCTWRASLIGAGPTLNCLNYAISAGHDIRVDPLGAVSTDDKVASEKKIDVRPQGVLTANCYSVNGSSGAIYGAINPLGDALEIPDGEVLSYYFTQATPLDPGLLPLSVGKLQLQGHLLSPQSNTISGSLNPLGMYVIDCGGNDIVITKSRLQCTLVLLNTGNCIVGEGVFWEAAQANYPALLVDGKVELGLTASPLNEAVAGRNLNPLETPYRGQSDGTTTSVYPSQIRGLIYATNDVQVSSVSSNSQVIGCIVSAKRVRVAGTLAVHSRNIFSSDPPPGFANFDKVRIAKGTIRRVAAP